MALLRLIAEGVGPFKRLDMDFSDGSGKPHLGPHILAGVNGSGKSTILRAIAAIFAQEGSGFDEDLWRHLTSGHHPSRTVALMTDGRERFAAGEGRGDIQKLKIWAEGVCDLPGDLKTDIRPALTQKIGLRARFGIEHDSAYFWNYSNIAAYSPSSRLAWLTQPTLTAPFDDPAKECLAFGATVQNEAIQAWLLSLYSKRAIASERHSPTNSYSRALSRFESALTLLYGEDVQFHVDIEPVLQPKLRFRNHELNFSQLPDGVRSTIGWVADFMMRQDQTYFTDASERPGILLLDEADAHLHPRWQRQLLPAMKAALPDVQIIATSHSPFVISSCPGARVHILDVDENGVATNRPSVPSPIGESVTTTLKEIFGVGSRFDIQTEKELNEWNDLAKRAAAAKITPDQEKRFTELTTILSERSEELRSIVGSRVRASDAVLNALIHR